jgi:hypothetical protein
MWVHFWTGDAPKSDVDCFKFGPFPIVINNIKDKINTLWCTYSMDVRKVLEGPQNSMWLGFWVTLMIPSSNINSSYKCAFGIDVGEVGGKAPEKYV